MRQKHKKDRKHVKGGFVGGNVRYKRGRAGVKMGKARNSRY